MQAYKFLGRCTLGLPDGRILLLREDDYFPPSLLPGREYIIVQLLATGTVISISNANAGRLAAADAVAAPQPGAVRGTSITVDGFVSPLSTRGIVRADESYVPGYRSVEWLT